jgi:TPP-dependent pyruvate/acetoin dehydrogenase alpha subunit
MFLECMTYRWKEHVGPGEDYDAGYRARAEAEPHMANDPVKKLGANLAPDDRARIDREVEAEIAAAIEFAETSAFPDDADLFTDVFAGVSP